jgi:hypothetical protein
MFTSNIPIDSARQAETPDCKIFFSKFVLGEQSGNFREEGTPWITSQPFNRFSLNSVLIDSIQHRLRKTASINGNKLLSLKTVVRTRWSYNRAGLTKRQKSLQGLAMYGHEVFNVLTRASKLIQDTLLPFHVSDNRLYRMTVWFMEKRRNHCQASTFSSDFDNVSFPCSNRSKLCFSLWVSPENLT